MGLTWTLEVLNYFLSTEDKQAPQALVILFNVLNIFQGIMAQKSIKEITR